MGTVKDLLTLALSKVGYAYSQGPTRTAGTDHYFDCSGFTYFLNQHVGGPTPNWDPQSHLQALYCRDHNLLIPGGLGSPTQLAIARRTPGALIFEGPQHAYVGGENIAGHVAISLGDGHTVEAMGHAWGTCIGNFDGRGWCNAGHFPGIDYTIALTQPHDGPVQGPQLQGDQMAIVIPSRARVGHDGREAYFDLDMQNDQVVAFNGAELHWRMPPGTKQPAVVKFGEALVYDIPTNGPHTGMAEDVEKVTVAGQDIYVPNNVLAVMAGDGGCAFADIILT